MLSINKFMEDVKVNLGDENKCLEIMKKEATTNSILLSKLISKNILELATDKMDKESDEYKILRLAIMAEIYKYDETSVDTKLKELIEEETEEMNEIVAKRKLLPKKDLSEGILELTLKIPHIAVFKFKHDDLSIIEGSEDLEMIPAIHAFFNLIRTHHYLDTHLIRDARVFIKGDCSDKMNEVVKTFTKIEEVKQEEIKTEEVKEKKEEPKVEEPVIEVYEGDDELNKPVEMEMNIEDLINDEENIDREIPLEEAINIIPDEDYTENLYETEDKSDPKEVDDFSSVIQKVADMARDMSPNGIEYLLNNEELVNCDMEKQLILEAAEKIKVNRKKGLNPNSYTMNLDSPTFKDIVEYSNNEFEPDELSLKTALANYLASFAYIVKYVKSNNMRLKDLKVVNGMPEGLSIKAPGYITDKFTYHGEDKLYHFFDSERYQLRLSKKDNSIIIADKLLGVDVDKF